MEKKIEEAIAASTSAFREAIREESGGTGVVCLTAGGNLSTIGRLFDRAAEIMLEDGRCPRCGAKTSECFCDEEEQA